MCAKIEKFNKKTFGYNGSDNFINCFLPVDTIRYMLLK